jgi:hypothetical protein
MNDLVTKDRTASLSYAASLEQVLRQLENTMTSCLLGNDAEFSLGSWSLETTYWTKPRTPPTDLNIQHVACCL